MEKSADNGENRARESRTRGLSLMWAVPLLAVIITAILIWQNTLNKGEKIFLSMENADGISAGQTQIKFRSVQVGVVEKVRLSDDYKQVILEVRMAKDTSDLLREDSFFWIVKPRVESNKISGLDTILSGAYIQILQGKSEARGRDFICHDSIPPNTDYDDGLLLTLSTGSNRRLSAGSTVSYRGFAVGSILRAYLDPLTHNVNYQVVIHKDYVDLLNSNTVFWIKSGFNMSFGLDGFSFSTETLESMLTGGINMDDFNRPGEVPFDAKAQHHLFDSIKEARTYHLREAPHYVVMLGEDLQKIAPGSQVLLHGMQVGEVIEAPWFESRGEAYRELQKIPVLLALHTGPEGSQEIKRYFDEELEQGRLCASVSSSSMLTPGNIIRLSFAPTDGSCRSETASYRNTAVIPLDSSPTLGSQLGALTARISTIDFEGISTELKTALGELSALLNSFKQISTDLTRTGAVSNLSKTLEELQKTLARVGKTASSFDKSADLYESLRDAIRDLDLLFKELKPGMAELGQKPNSIIFGSESKDPEPRLRR